MKTKTPKRRGKTNAELAREVRRLKSILGYVEGQLGLILMPHRSNRFTWPLPTPPESQATKVGVWFECSDQPLRFVGLSSLREILFYVKNPHGRK